MPALFLGPPCRCHLQHARLGLGMAPRPPALIELHRLVRILEDHLALAAAQRAAEDGEARVAVGVVYHQGRIAPARLADDPRPAEALAQFEEAVERIGVGPSHGAAVSRRASAFARPDRARCARAGTSSRRHPR